MSSNTLENSPLSVVRNDGSSTIFALLEPLDHILNDGNVTEILINKPFEAWSKQRNGWNYHEIEKLTATYINSLANSLIVYNKMAKNPISSVILPNGERCEIIQPPACTGDSAALSIRKYQPSVFSVEELKEQGAFDNYRDVSFNQIDEEEALQLMKKTSFDRLSQSDFNLLKLKREGKILEFLEACVLCKKNIVIAGKTGSGKTTFARSLIEKVPLSERIITIEDVHELHLENHKNKKHLIYGEGKGRVSAEACLKSCMRLSPDRIILAEIRGGEAWEYLNSLNTAHPGSITTVHANNAAMTYNRIATLIKKSKTGQFLDLDVIKSELYTTIEVVLYFEDRQLKEVFFDPAFSKKYIQ